MRRRQAARGGRRTVSSRLLDAGAEGERDLPQIGQVKSAVQHRWPRDSLFVPRDEDHQPPELPPERTLAGHVRLNRAINRGRVENLQRIDPVAREQFGAEGTALM